MKRIVCVLSIIVVIAMFLTPLIQPGEVFAASLREEMIAKAKKEGTLVVAGSLAEDIATNLTGFKKMYPFINVRHMEINTKDTINRVVTEAQAGRLSIDWTGTSEDGAEILARRGFLAKNDFPHLKDFRANSQPPHGLYVSGVVNCRVQGIYNTELVSPAEAPKSWDEMGDPKWKGKTMLARSAEEFPGRLAWLWRDKDGKWDWERSFELFRKLKAHDPVIGQSFPGGAQRVAAGEVGIFWFAPPTVAANLALRGAPLGLIVIPKFFGGLRAWTNLKDAAHPGAAWLMTDFLTSAEGQYEWTEKIGAHLPLNLKAKLGKGTQWAVDQGISHEKLELIDLRDADKIYSPEVQEKSETFFFKLLGLR
ncbi:MAG: extracellular solute-binding protein [Desulfobacterales bacterium]|nr:extracellular solute-binding protein [Desulfobacterales bacterium]